MKQVFGEIDEHSYKLILTSRAIQTHICVLFCFKRTQEINRDCRAPKPTTSALSFWKILMYPLRKDRIK